MPKILIEEKDRTSPGTPDSYANYSVLVAGFAGDDGDYLSEKPTVAADSNGVFEFTSASDFEKTIGLASPEVLEGTFHYGNQMAYELLGLGYTVIYKVITEINELNDVETWEIFKDKANYDFRFITHGLLCSSNMTDDQRAMSVRREAVKEALAKLKEIDAAATEAVSDQEENYEAERADLRNEMYQSVMNSYEGFLAFDKVTGGHDTEPYNSYALPDEDDIGAIYGVNEELEYLNNALKDLVTEEIINSVNVIIANLAEYTAGTDGRGDCIALVELDKNSYVKTASNGKPEELIAIAATSGKLKLTHDNSKYCAITVPSVVYKMEDNSNFGNNKEFPGAFHYLACFMNALKQGFREWYAAAGYTRGVASYTVDYTPVKLGEIAINLLEPRNLVDKEGKIQPEFACNVIANFRGSYYLWGNRTAFKLYSEKNQKYGDLTASSFLNIRQLCTTIKKQLYVACRKFTFDPNSDTLWFNFINAIKPTLEAMKADQGIRDYKILKVFTDKKATLKAKIRIIPIEAVEDFDLEVSLEDSFGETAAVVTE